MLCSPFILHCFELITILGLLFNWAYISDTGFVYVGDLIVYVYIAGLL